MILIEQLRYRWPKQPDDTLAIDHLHIQPGEHVFLQGASGSGKTTLLNLIAGLNHATSGQIHVNGTDLASLSSRQRDHFRAQHLGYIFQMFNLIPYLSVIENVTLPCQFSKERKQRALANSSSLEEEAKRLLAHLGLDSALFGKTTVTSLSIGQQQRVAAARALMGMPTLLIADEPTSALDSDNRQRFIELLFQECRAHKTTLLFVSHDQQLAPLFQQQIKLDAINHRHNAHEDGAL